MAPESARDTNLNATFILLKESPTPVKESPLESMGASGSAHEEKDNDSDGKAEESTVVRIVVRKVKDPVKVDSTCDETVVTGTAPEDILNGAKRYKKQHRRDPKSSD